MPESLTKEHFLADPGRMWFSHAGPFPVNWIREAWASVELRSEVVYYYSATADFFLRRRRSASRRRL